MKIKVVKQRRKTISLKIVDSNNAELKVPISLPEKEINNFVESKRSWIEKQSKRFAENECFANSFDLEGKLYINGEFYADANSVIIGYDSLSEKAKKNAVRNFYKSQFWNLQQTTKDVSEKFGLSYDKLLPTTSVKVWGSYNSKRVMKLNWKLVILPKELVYYVVCHELAHSVHFNHSTYFWNEVERMCPNCKSLRKKLNEFGFLLTRDF